MSSLFRIIANLKRLHFVLYMHACIIHTNLLGEGNVMNGLVHSYFLSERIFIYELLDSFNRGFF